MLFVFLYQFIAAFSYGTPVLAAFGNARILYALGISIASASVTSVLAVILGIPLAYFYMSVPFRGKTIIQTLTIDVPQTFPPIAEGIIFMAMLGPESPFHINLSYTFTALVLAKFFVSAPFVVALTLRKFLEIQKTGLDVLARSLGAHPLHVLSTIFIPLALRDIIAGTSICWARAMGELGGSLIFAGVIAFHTEDIPTFIAVNSGVTDQALAATILVTVFSAVALILFKTVVRGNTLWKGLFYKP
jgi:molybdate transport system permease protein